MFAVIKIGGRQFCVTQNNIIKINKVEAEPGTILEINDILMYSDIDNGVAETSGSYDTRKTIVGTPTIAGAVAKAQVLKQVKEDKVIVFKKRRRHNYRRKRGHRQPMTLVKILEISLGN